MLVSSFVVEGSSTVFCNALRRLEPTAWKSILAEGIHQSDGSLHITVEHLLQHPATDVADLNIGDVFKGRRFRISNAEALVS